MGRVVSYVAEIDRDETGTFVGYFPDVRGCVAQGKTLDDIQGSLKGALSLHLHVREDRGMPLPEARYQRRRFRNPFKREQYVTVTVDLDEPIQYVDPAKAFQ